MSPLILVISSVLVAADPAPVDFDNQLIPVLTKAGCNSGACHGAAIGRGGFRLSLYGGDPEFDYRSIALESEGRRVNLARPDVSIVVLKPTETIEHGGGVRLDDDGSGAELLRRWIREGATRFSTKSLVGFDVSPKVHIADDVGAELQLRATAKFNDGSTVDVTPWTVFTPEDAAAVEIDQQAATAKLLRRGRHIVVARYLDRNIPVEIIAPLSDAAVRLQGEPRRNFIDDHVLGLLETLRLPTSPLANDATFLRRVTLDLTGRLPTPAQQRRFQQGDDAKKRDAVVDELLASDEFNEYWTMQLAKLLRIRSQRGGEKEAAQTYHRWLREQLAKRLPYDELARRMLLSAG
ncbi:MAG: DUF1549 domain-containing protein, partial [Pirellulaceae bacterium]|nr:DUF1549 domain-containing protein [Pirellulaceae bacterium]